MARAVDAARLIAEECDAIKAMLLEKNRAYGNSALYPVRVFSRADVDEQIRVRIDDKLSRLMRGSNAGEDVEKDLMGYLVLLRIAKRRAGQDSGGAGVCIVAGKGTDAGRGSLAGDIGTCAQPSPSPSCGHGRSGEGAAEGDSADGAGYSSGQGQGDGAPQPSPLPGDVTSGGGAVEGQTLERVAAKLDWYRGRIDGTDEFAGGQRFALRMLRDAVLGEPGDHGGLANGFRDVLLAAFARARQAPHAAVQHESEGWTGAEMYPVLSGITEAEAWGSHIVVRTDADADAMSFFGEVERLRAHVFRVPPSPAPRADNACSFCGQTPPEGQLIRGERASICHPCVVVSADMVEPSAKSHAALGAAVDMLDRVIEEVEADHAEAVEHRDAVRIGRAALVASDARGALALIEPFARPIASPKEP